jgi:hypothetical protein
MAERRTDMCQQAMMGDSGEYYGGPMNLVDIQNGSMFSKEILREEEKHYKYVNRF